MISIDTEVTGFDPHSWNSLVSLVAPGFTVRAPESALLEEDEPGGALLLIYGEGGVTLALHSRLGAVEPGPWSGPQDLELAAARHGARYALSAREGCLEETYERARARFSTDDDFFGAVVVALDALRALIADGRVHTVPRLPKRVPAPTPELLRRVWDALLPDGTVALVAAFGDVKLDTALVLRRRGAALDRVMGLEALRAMVGPLGGDFRRDFRVVRAGVERALGPLSLGLYAETETFRALVRSADSGVWARAIAAREVMIDPMPAWVAMAVGAGALRGALGRSQALFEALGLAGLFGPMAGTVRLATDLLREVNFRAALCLYLRRHQWTQRYFRS